MSFVGRRIDATITIGTGQFGEIVGDTIKLQGLRISAVIGSWGGETQGTCDVRIYGLPLDLINRMTAIGPVNRRVMGNNAIQLDAGDIDGPLTTIFKGVILTAYGDFSQSPNVSLNIHATSAALAAIKPVDPSSFKGSADVATMMKTFADDAGFSFTNYGVNTVLSDSYFDGSTLDKIKACARAADIYYSTDNQILEIWPKGSAKSGEIPLFSPSNGLIGYPSFGSQNIIIRTLFSPTVRQGGKFQIDGSIVEAANNTWYAVSMVHNIESEMPQGRWETTITGAPLISAG